VPASNPFVFEDDALAIRARPLLRRLPALSGAPIRIRTAPGIRDHRGPIHAGAFLRERRIALNCTRAEFPRIFLHELGHFIWLRMGNPGRLRYESVLRAEIHSGARGELGWSAEWRKAALTAGDIGGRTRRWREYCCESFCDTAAWLYSGVRRHPEFKLAARHQLRRRAWFEEAVKNRRLSI
jgi:hypothetical protein